MEEQGKENEFYRNLSQLINTTEKTIRNSTHNYLPLIDDTLNYVEAALYSNLIRLYEHNLNDDFFKKVNMGSDDRAEFMDLVGGYFERARSTSESNYNQGEVDFHLYQEFRAAVHDFGDDVYWLLLGVERYADLISCEHRLLAFKGSMNEIRARPVKGRRKDPTRITRNEALRRA
jgi:hypothetical protein